jgi:hypothetical protein
MSRVESWDGTAAAAEENGICFAKRRAKYEREQDEVIAS